MGYQANTGQPRIRPSRILIFKAASGKSAPSRSGVEANIVWHCVSLKVTLARQSTQLRLHHRRIWSDKKSSIHNSALARQLNASYEASGTTVKILHTSLTRLLQRANNITRVNFWPVPLTWDASLVGPSGLLCGCRLPLGDECRYRRSPVFALMIVWQIKICLCCESSTWSTAHALNVEH